MESDFNYNSIMIMIWFDFEMEWISLFRDFSFTVIKYVLQAFE